MAEAADQVTITAQEIYRLLPHRFPFLLVDRIEAAVADESCIGIKNVTFNEPFFQGHFPDQPVMPGVLLLEGMAQSAGALCMHHLRTERMRNQVYFLTIDKAKFRKPVGPGDTIEYHMRKINKKRNMWWFRGEAKVGGQIVAEAEVGAVLNLIEA
jgi:3-hydroxyacyl-[acyl-carrier-protein] dehydratase